MTGPRLSSLIQIAAASRNGERTTRPSAASSLSTADGISSAPSSRSLRLLPAPAGPMPPTVPEAEDDRGLGQHVVAGDPHHSIVGEARRERRDPEQRQL